MPVEIDEYGDEERYLTDRIHYTRLIKFSEIGIECFFRSRSRYEYERSNDGKKFGYRSDVDKTSKKQHVATSCLNGIESASNNLWEHYGGKEYCTSANPSVAK